MISCKCIKLVSIVQPAPICSVHAVEVKWLHVSWHVRCWNCATKVDYTRFQTINVKWSYVMILSLISLWFRCLWQEIYETLVDDISALRASPTQNCKQLLYFKIKQCLMITVPTHKRHKSPHKHSMTIYVFTSERVIVTVCPNPKL